MTILQPLVRSIRQSALPQFLCMMVVGVLAGAGCGNSKSGGSGSGGTAGGTGTGGSGGTDGGDARVQPSDANSDGDASPDRRSDATDAPADGGTTLGGCIDKVGTTNTSVMVINQPDGICDTYGSFTLTAAASGAAVTNVTLFRTDATGLNLTASGGHFNHGVWSTETGSFNIPGNYVAHLFLATTPNPGPNDFLALTETLSLTLAAGDNKVYYFADGDDTMGGAYGFGLNVWLGGAAAATPGLSAYTAVPGGPAVVDGTTGCSPAYDGTCGVSANTVTTTSSPIVTLTSFTVAGLGGASAPPDAGASD